MVTPGFETLVGLNKSLVQTNRENRNLSILLTQAAGLLIDCAEPVYETSQGAEHTEYVISADCLEDLRSAMILCQP